MKSARNFCSVLEKVCLFIHSEFERYLDNVIFFSYHRLILQRALIVNVSIDVSDVPLPQPQPPERETRFSIS